MQFHGTFTTDTEAQAAIARAAQFTDASLPLIAIACAVAVAAILATALSR